MFDPKVLHFCLQEHLRGAWVRRPPELPCKGPLCVNFHPSGALKVHHLFFIDTDSNGLFKVVYVVHGLLPNSLRFVIKPERFSDDT